MVPTWVTVRQQTLFVVSLVIVSVGTETSAQALERKDGNSSAGRVHRSSPPSVCLQIRGNVDPQKPPPPTTTTPCWQDKAEGARSVS